MILCCLSRVAGQTGVGLSPEIAAGRSHSHRFLFDSVWQMPRRLGGCVLSFISPLKLRSFVSVIFYFVTFCCVCWYVCWFIFLFGLLDVLVFSTIVLFPRPFVS